MHVDQLSERLPYPPDDEPTVEQAFASYHGKALALMKAEGDIEALRAEWKVALAALNRAILAAQGK